jgi:hypothetical protein
MPKSKYPDKLDTSVEIPVVRDNITEIGSDVFNSLRSAIFNIEKSLGINPQGAVGNTVSARLSNALDENGNILKEALDRSNVLSGPITDSDVSKVAAVDESKLRLNYPTQLLQDEISILDNKISLFIKTLQELNRIVSAHVHIDATNRHLAQAITVVGAEAEESSVAASAIEDGTLQEALEEIYNAHMHYTGEGIEANNNSHKALQIFYNNEDTSDLIPSEDVQGAIDDLVNLEGEGLRNSILNLNSNGIIRTGSVYDAFEVSEVGRTLVEASTITYSGPSGTSLERISFPDSPEPISAPRPFDVLTIVDSPNEDDNKEYLISNVELTGAGNIDYVDVFGGPGSPLTVGMTANITRSPYTSYNENGFNCSVRPRHAKTNTPDIQVALPNAATIISSGIRPSNVIDGVFDTISIEIDGGSAVEINIFDSYYDIQTIDTIVHKINEYAVSNKLNIFAYKVRALRCFELAITHNLPNFEEDLKNRTLKLTEASSSDASEALGLSYILDREIEGTTGNAYHINGRLLEEFGQIQKYTSNSISIGLGTTNVSAVGTIDFFEEGIRSGDLCVIEGSSESDDDGTYRVHSVASDILTLDSAGSTLKGELSDDSAIFIVRSTAPIGEMEFEETGGLILFDVFVDQNKNIFYKRRLDSVGVLYSGDFYAVVSDLSRGFIGNNDNYTINIDTSGTASLTESSSGIPGEEIFVGATGSYKVPSADGMAYVILEVFASGNPSVSISSDLNGYAEIPDSVLHLCRGVYSAELGFVLGGPEPESGGAVPKLIDKRTTGTVDDTIISEPLLERYIQGPRNELRSSGIIRGASVESVTDNGDGTCIITVNPGVLVVNGVRFEYLGVSDLVYKYDDGPTNKFYVALDGYGCLVLGNEIDPDGGTDYTSPFVDQTVAYIGYIDSEAITDLRLFIDHLDYKVIGDITVANDQRFGHFTDIKTAVDYARMFSKMFPAMGTPSVFVKEGIYEIEETIVIDFDLTLKGSGPNTIIKRSSSFPPASDKLYGIDNIIFSIGEPDIDTEIIYGVELSDFTYQGVSGWADVGDSVIVLKHSITLAPDPSVVASFLIKNIKFIGATDFVISDTTAASLPNEMPIRIGDDTDGATYAHIIITGCMFRGMGYEKGVIHLGGDDCYFEHINVYGNIASSIIDTALYSYIDDAATMLSATVLVQVQEVANTG